MNFCNYVNYRLMKISKYLTTFIAVIALPVWAANLNISEGAWSIVFKSNTLTYILNGNILIKNAYVIALDPHYNEMSSKEYPSVSLIQKTIKDNFGTGKQFTYRFSGNLNKDDIEQNIYIYPNLPYILVEASVIASSGQTSSTKICPIVSDSPNTLSLIGANNNRIYNMPFANDNWATFSTAPWEVGQQIVSCEATALFNIDSRKSIVIGSVDHSSWKSAVYVTPNAGNRLRRLIVEAGHVSERTWDVMSGKPSSKRHGAVKGTRVDSPRFMLGYFDDWRVGLETYGEANTVLCPKYKWTKDESLFGWQSWGGMEFGLNYKSAMSLLDFFEKELKPIGFHNKNGRCHIVLDSGWSALNDTQLKHFVDKCKALGFVAGIYTTPFTYWGGADQVNNNEQWEGGNLREMILKIDGKYRHINGYSLDPTHPAVKDWNRRTFEKFRNWGFEFVKIDFLNNGSQEADSWYNPNITTGLQAYNYGMDYIKEFCGEEIMLDLSIAPIFPAKAHARRIGCDAWGNLTESMYTLNCINGSWWLDKVYVFNDPDHMCLSKVLFSGKGSNDEQEARIRYTSGLITGMLLLGGTYAYEGDYVNNYGQVIGYNAERNRVVKFAANKNLTEMACIGKTFRPVEGKFGHKATLYTIDDISTDNEFIYDTPDAFYYVVFNFASSDTPLSFRPDFKRLGVDLSEFVKVTELWESKVYIPSSLEILVPGKDVRIYRFERKNYSMLETPSVASDKAVKIECLSGNLRISASELIVAVSLYNIYGSLITKHFLTSASHTVTIPMLTDPGIAITRVELSSGLQAVNKIVVR